MLHFYILCAVRRCLFNVALGVIAKLYIETAAISRYQLLRIRESLSWILLLSRAMTELYLCPFLTCAKYDELGRGELFKH